ncbi:hypothetical protein ASG60_15770 [Methylobacterium sp. Leaf469]|uniref:DUF4160 domain-containing protein n=1 Tax=Methylobacterium sp. Leaf469 TaxID=1736387 RepID=UPI0006F792A0|nr:DUF4160 domain-containing protein [Methylobacterium sp. Leaf469]KQT86536.1 hypothetical protein ASG60_15770 [Methylobacterium sp. Leaf469]
MVTVFRSGGMRVIIFIDDHEPAHVHVFGDGHAKINLVPEPVLVWAEGMTRGELRKAMKIVVEQRNSLLTRWRTIHG